MSRLIILSGPKGCGKTELVKRLQQEWPKLVNRRCKDKLFQLTADFFCVDIYKFFEIYENRELKEVALQEFSVRRQEYLKLCRLLDITPVETQGMVPLTIRQAMIYVSEVICKPAFGKEYFGEARCKAMSDDEIAVDDSGGFKEEVNPTLKRFGHENHLIIRVHGRGTFYGDSRSYLPDGICYNTVDVWNVDEEEQFQEECVEIVRRWLNNENVLEGGEE